MQFTLMGFTGTPGNRIFEFQGMAADSKKFRFTVTANLSMIRSYGIMVQELPLLCRSFLEQSDREASPRDLKEAPDLTFSEDQMRLHAAGCAASREEALRKKSQRRHVPAPSAANRQASPWAGPVEAEPA